MIRIANRDDVPPGQSKMILVGEKQLALFHIGDEFYVIDNECPHMGAPLGDGFLEGKIVTCPLHAWQFDVTTGKMPGHPKLGVKTYPVVLEGEAVMVDLDAGSHD